MIEVSILIVSKNRKQALQKTLEILETYINYSKHEICVFLDGCTDDSQSLIPKFSSIKWLVSETSIGASHARNKLYKIANGTIFIGLDDDAHPLQANFIELVQKEFNYNNQIGILAFQEIKGVFNSDEEALKQAITTDSYICNSFIGCGFAIKKNVYNATNGFPKWIDIYGEEDCVALEVISKGYDIKYSSHILINHRVDFASRKTKGYHEFRFQKQLKNTMYYYLVYYRYPLIPIVKLLAHNLKKYAFKSFKYFYNFWKSIITVIITLPKVLQYREPVKTSVIDKKKRLKAPKF